jgi:symplekin
VLFLYFTIYVKIDTIARCRLPASSQYIGQINEALGQQGVRMDKAAAEERKRKAGLVETRKRPSSNPSEPSDNKRIKLENETTQNSSASFLAAFDFTSLPASLITSLIVANLEAFAEPRLISLVDTYRQNWRLGAAQPTMTTGSIAMPVPKPAAASPPIQNMSTSSIPTGPRKNAYIMDSTLTPPPQAMADAAIKDEPVDPLQMDIDEDEFEFEPEKLNEEVCRCVAGMISAQFLASSCLRHLKQKTISWLPA